MTDERRVECLVLETPAGRFAVESGWLRELVELGDVTPVPGSQEAIAGVTSVRGSIVVVLSGASLLGTAEESLLVLDREDDRRPVGLGVGAVAGVETFDAAAITTPSAFDGALPGGDLPIKAVLLPFGSGGPTEPTFVIDAAALGKEVPSAAPAVDA